VRFDSSPRFLYFCENVIHQYVCVFMTYNTCPAQGATTSCARVALFRLGAQLGLDHNGETFPGADVTYYSGWMDDVRVWSEARSDEAIQDAAFEIVQRSQATCL
jgi:hypothetical protein